MVLLENKTVADIVTENINTTKVFKKFNIDFGFNGNLILKKACKKNNVNLNNILYELKSVDKKKFYLKDYNSWSLELLVKFLVDIHHNKKQDDVLLLNKLSSEINYKYTDVQHPYYEKLHGLIQTMTDEILIKMNHEETVIFPYIKNLISINNNKKSNDIKHPILKNSIKKFENHRHLICKKFKAIKKLTHNFMATKNVDSSLKLLFERLERFKFELQEHNHIEKNILLPKALVLEASLVD